MVVTGTTGQIARALLEAGAPAGVAVTAVGRPAFDLVDLERGSAAVAAARPDIIVNAAAFTRAEEAEAEPGTAQAVNVAGPAALAAQARRLGIPIIHLSTAYVFDGAQPTPYRESDPPAPLGVYGATKLAGEQAVMAAHPQHVILRMSWVFSPFGRNVLTAILSQGERGDTGKAISGVSDQTGQPTAAADIAAGIIAVARNLVQGHAGFGLFHMASPGAVTPAAFATEIFALSGARGGPYATIVPTTAASYSTRVKRPANAELDCAKLAAIHGVALPPWRPALAASIDRILETPT